MPPRLGNLSCDKLVICSIYLLSLSSIFGYSEMEFMPVEEKGTLESGRYLTLFGEKKEPLSKDSSMSVQ